jgi:hypothetical protein
MTDYSNSPMTLECQAILAAQEGDDDALSEITLKMLPGELASLADAADELATQCRWAIKRGAHAHADDL